MTQSDLRKVKHLLKIIHQTINDASFMYNSNTLRYLDNPIRTIYKIIDKNFMDSTFSKTHDDLLNEIHALEQRNEYNDNGDIFFFSINHKRRKKPKVVRSNQHGNSFIELLEAKKEIYLFFRRPGYVVTLYKQSPKKEPEKIDYYEF